MIDLHVHYPMRLLGDVGRSAPERWLWGGDGNLDGLLIVFSDPVRHKPEDRARVVARTGPLDLRVGPVPGRTTAAELCD